MHSLSEPQLGIQIEASSNVSQRRSSRPWHLPGSSSVKMLSSGGSPIVQPRRHAPPMHTLPSPAQSLSPTHAAVQ
ncbi:hypothetical protein BE08_01305 [Sorangium cellulosum]|uniref:Uncharacterized protein n=1 Tax=Sorangium cellulosum TaxID=56 RepID=A0A150P8A3_SORCE|nr:hypothetical protein BE08_01305 [Sorangium cellulosum]